MEGTREGSSISLIEALENYASHHPETVEELLGWPATKFEYFYKKFQQRQIIEGLEAEKNQMVAALWANSAWDESEDKNARKSAIAQIESEYEDAVSKIKAYGTSRADEEEIDKNNPFFAATERGLAKVEQKMGYAPAPEAEEINYMKGLDQAS